MVTIFVTMRSGEKRTISAQAENSLMEAIRNAGMDDLLALCGGSCSCATCHVYIDQGSVESIPPITESEDGLLEGSVHRNTLSRLSCQIRVTPQMEGVSVTIAPAE
jgi:2Fe-2S ferredoxin